MFFVVKYFLLWITEVTMKHVGALSLPTCHTETKKPVVDLQDGPLGETGTFPWLGLIKVFIEDEGTPITALTGTVFVTHTHALVSAEDVAKMPSWIFYNNTQAMFIPASGLPRIYKLLNYIAHPEYKNPTFNTIALVTLIPFTNGPALPAPVCWNQEAYDSNNKAHLYIVGFTDEYDLLEKFIFKSKYVDFNLCEDFYDKEGLNDKKRIPMHYQCASTVNVKNTCVWDTGMALVSNATGHWVLVGFGIYGPGCSVPARFIKLLPYYKWINTIVNPEITSSRRGFRKQADDSDDDRHEGIDLIEEFKSPYPFDVDDLYNAFFNVDRISHTSVMISMNTLNDTTECEQQIYSGRTAIFVSSNEDLKELISVNYKLTLYDLLYENITCVRISLIADKYTDAYLYVKDSIDHAEVTEWDQTPNDLLQDVFPRSRQKFHTKPDYIKYPHHRDLIENHNLYFTFQFKGEACYAIIIYARPVPPPPPMKIYQYSKETTHSLRRHGWRASGYGKGYSSVAAPIEDEILFKIGTISAASYAAYVPTIVLTTIGVYAHLTHGINRPYDDKLLLKDVPDELHTFGSFNFNTDTISSLLYQYAIEAKSKNETIPTKNRTIIGTGVADVWCSYRQSCAHRYKGVVGLVPGVGTSKTQVNINMRPTFTTIDALTYSESFFNYTTDQGEIRIPYIVKLHQWCFFLHMEKQTHCYYGKDGYNDDNLPPALWSKTPTP